MENSVKKCIKVGITGGSGAGKSTVCSYIRNQGYEVIDSDEIAKNILAKGTKQFSIVKEHFGEGILLPDGDIDRKKLGSIVFADRKELNFLQNVVTKGAVEEVRRLMKNFCYSYSGGIIEPADQRINKNNQSIDENRIVFVDAPILFETGLNMEMDFVWMVHSKKEIRLERLAKRDGLTFEELEKRMGAQMPEEEKISKSDFVIENNGTIEKLSTIIHGELNRLKQLEFRE